MTKRVGYLGPHGTYSEEIVLSLYKEQEVSLTPFSSIYQAIIAVAEGKVDECIVPVENSIEGPVNITLDTLAHEVNLLITREIVFPVRQNLLVKKSGLSITTIVSHPQALAQCQRTIRILYPSAQIIPVESTAEAARRVAVADGSYAAVGSLNAAAIYGLEVLAADIHDNAANSTRFISLSNNPVKCSLEKWKTSFVCQINGERPGSLYKILEEFASREVNLTRVESRPARTELGMYIFFFDVEGSLENTAVAEAIKAVKDKCVWFKNFGSYPAMRFEQIATAL